MSKTPNEKIVKPKEVPVFPTVKGNGYPIGRPPRREANGDHNNNNARCVKSYTDLSKIIEAAEEKEEVPEVAVLPEAMSPDNGVDEDSFSEEGPDLGGVLDASTITELPESNAKGPSVMVETKLHAPQALNTILRDMIIFEKEAKAIRSEEDEDEHSLISMSPQFLVNSHKKLELLTLLAEKEISQLGGNVKCKMCGEPSTLWCCYGTSYCSGECFEKDPEGTSHPHWTVPKRLVPLAYQKHQMEEKLRRQEAECSARAESRERNVSAVPPQINRIIRAEKSDSI